MLVHGKEGGAGHRTTPHPRAERTPPDDDSERVGATILDRRRHGVGSTTVRHYRYRWFLEHVLGGHIEFYGCHCMGAA